MAAAVSEPGKTLRGPPTSFSAGPVLLGDIGATNARFAVLSDSRLGPIKSFAVAGFSRFSTRSGRSWTVIAGIWRSSRRCWRGPGWSTTTVAC